MNKKYFIKHLTLLLISVVIYGSTEKILVNIDRNIREIDKDSACDASQWANNLENSCKCCLIKRVPQLDQGKKADEIIVECIEKGQCSQDIDIVKNIEKSGVDTDLALRNLYNQSVVIKKVDTHGVSFDSRGNFTEQGVATFLERAYKEGKLPYEDFKSVTCIDVKELGGEKGTGTLQLFLVKSTCSKIPTDYIFKEMMHAYESRRLAEFFGIKELDNLIWPHKQAGLPSIVIPIAFINYGNHYFSLMPKAPGIRLDMFMVDYFLNPTEKNKKAAQEAYYKVGHDLGTFDKLFMQKDSLKTVAHSDFHHQNVFYEPSTQQVSFIDNEKMPATFKNPEPFTYDIITLLFVSLLEPSTIPAKIKNKLSNSEWLSIITEPFLKGYISAYPQKDHLKIFNEIEKNLKEYVRWNTIHVYANYKDVLDEQFRKVREWVTPSASKID